MTLNSTGTTQSGDFRRLIIAYLAAFSLIPMITRNIIPHDMIENLYWGKETLLGYAKHPPLFAWISYFFYKCFFSWPESLYLLTQLNLLLGFYFLFQTAKLIFKDEVKSYASVLIFMASVCAAFGNEKFNASTILMSLLPAINYFFVRLLKFNKNSDGILLGIFSALAFLGKYFALLHIGCMGLFLISDRDRWKFLRTPPIYWAAIVFLAGVSWHLFWMADNDFITLKYALDKSVNSPKNYFSAWNFVMMQCLFFGTSFWA
ncbi:MAG: glycosyltransferase family 39 protein, partial [Holosporaceae bacterium]|nr:glycosyltransferase family 39 protein [Holosporaceae bacterium]